MKKYILPSLLVLALAGGLAWAQNFTSALQGTQDPRGPVPFDSNFNAYFPNHINPYGSKGTAPTLSNASTSALLGTSTDNAGTISVSGTAFQLNFGQAFGQVPACIVQEMSGTTAPTFTVLATQISATTVATGHNYNYLCFSAQ